jgi:HK97 family phage prohead protease
MAPRTTDFDVLGIETIRSFYCGDIRTRDRQHADVKWRASGDPEKTGVRILTGYPAVFGQATTLYESRHFVIRETIAPEFFDGVLQDDCHLNYSHESPSAMCRNGLDGPGGMQLSVDAHGLRVYAQVPMDDVDAQRLAPKMDRGVVDQMSFAFTVAREDCLQTTDEDGREVYEYTLRECERLYDVCICPLGAYSQTEAMLRSLSAMNGRSEEGRLDIPARSEEGQEPEPRAQAGACVQLDARKRSVLLTESAVAVSQFKPRKA